MYISYSLLLDVIWLFKHRKIVWKVVFVVNYILRLVFAPSIVKGKGVFNFEWFNKQLKIIFFWRINKYPNISVGIDKIHFHGRILIIFNLQVIMVLKAPLEVIFIFLHENSWRWLELKLDDFNSLFMNYNSL